MSYDLSKIKLALNKEGYEIWEHYTDKRKSGLTRHKITVYSKKKAWRMMPGDKRDINKVYSILRRYITDVAILQSDSPEHGIYTAFVWFTK